MAEIHRMQPSGHMSIEQALDCAKRDFADLDDVIVLGMDADGATYTLSSHMSKERALWILEKVKASILSGAS